MSGKEQKNKDGILGLRRIDPSTTIYPFLAIFALCLFFILDPGLSVFLFFPLSGHHSINKFTHITYLYLAIIRLCGLLCWFLRSFTRAKCIAVIYMALKRC